MTKLPPLKAGEVIRGLKKLGFEKVRQKGLTPYSIIRTAGGRPFQFTPGQASVRTFFPISSSS
jgi:hypothetical protein